MAASICDARSLAAYPDAPAPLWTASTTGEPAAVTASQIASTWSFSVIDERSASGDSKPGSVSAVTLWPSARSRSATSSQAHAPSQNPGTRMIDGVVMVATLEARADTEPRLAGVSFRKQDVRQLLQEPF